MSTSCHLTFFTFLVLTLEVQRLALASSKLPMSSPKSSLSISSYTGHKWWPAYLISRTKSGKTSKRRQKGRVKTCCMGGATYSPASTHLGLSCLCAGSRLTVLCGTLKFLEGKRAYFIREWPEAKLRMSIKSRKAFRSCNIMGRHICGAKLLPVGVLALSTALVLLR